MKHYITFEEFSKMIQGLYGETALKCETADGTVEHIRFRSVYFFYRVILYTYPFTNDVGLIQEDEEEGWEKPVREVWYDITEQCGWRPFVSV